MQRWRGCLPIIGYFAELQERQAMAQASESEVVIEHSEGEGIRENGMQTIDSEGDTIRDNSEHGN
jgi:hypothetical protein